MSDEHLDKTYAITLDTLLYCMEPIMKYMKDPNVFEVYANPDGCVWIDTLGKGRVKTDLKLQPSEITNIIMNVAAITEQIIPQDKPVLDADIPANYMFPKCRFEGNRPPVVPAPTMNIRKHPQKIFTLEDYLKQGTITESQYETLLKAVHDKKNIIAAGGTKSGKTTFLNALLAEISKLDDRVILIEDTPELQCKAEDCVPMHATSTFSMEDALHQVLRMTPDRIVVGEVRGGEALALLDAWSTGHQGGCSTVHSNSARDTLLRLENMTARVSKNPQQATIAQAVNIIVYLKYVATKRSVEEIIELDGWDHTKKEYLYHKIG